METIYKQWETDICAKTDTNTSPPPYTGAPKIYRGKTRRRRANALRNKLHEHGKYAICAINENRKLERGTQELTRVAGRNGAKPSRGGQKLRWKQTHKHTPLKKEDGALGKNDTKITNRRGKWVVTSLALPPGQENPTISHISEDAWGEITQEINTSPTQETATEQNTQQKHVKIDPDIQTVRTHNTTKELENAHK